MGFHRVRIRVFKAVGFALSAVLSLTALAACNSNGGSSSSSSTSGGTTAALAYYKGKTIKIITNSPGNALYGLAQAFKPGLEKYLGATVEIEAVPGADVTAQNQAAAQAGNGLTIGVLSVLSDQTALIFNASEQSFNMSKLEYIASFPLNGLALASCKGSPYKTIDQLLASKKTVTVLDPTQAAGSLMMHLLFKAYGTPVKYISGYTPINAGTGCLRGDGDVTMVPIPYVTNAAGSQMAPGVSPLLISGVIPSGEPYTWMSKKAPALLTYAAAHPPTTSARKQALALVTDLNGPGSGDAIFLPAGETKGELTVLRDAITKAIASSSVKKQLLNLGVPPSLVNPDSVVPWLKQASKYTAAVRQAAGVS